MNADLGFQLDLLGALRRRGPLMAAVTGATFLAAYWVAMALPNEYGSYTTLLVEPQAVSGRLVESGVADSDLNERLHLMTAEILSRPRLSRVIDDLALFTEESKSMPREDIIDLMRQQVTVVPVLPELEQNLRTRRDIEINTFRVEFSSTNPQVAADVSLRLANDFIEEHIAERIEVTQKSLDFISAEQTRLSAAIERIEKQIAKVKDENPGSLPEDMQANQRLFERAVSGLNAAQREIDIARSDEAFWANQAVEAAALNAPNDDASPARRLQLLELQLDALRARGYTDKHPDVIHTLAEVEEVRASVAAGAEPDTEGGTAPTNFAQRSAQAEQARARLRVAAATAEIERLNKDAERIQSSIAFTPRVAEQLDSLHRQHRQLSENLRDFNNRRLEANVQADLERRQLGEQFRILEPAFPATEPSSPNRLLILMIGMLLGLTLGASVAVVAESADSSVHASQQLQSSIGIPVLAAIPNILLEADIAARRRRWTRNLVATAGVVMFCLVGGAATYVVVNGGQSAVAVEEPDPAQRVPAQRPPAQRPPAQRAEPEPTAEEP